MAVPVRDYVEYRVGEHQFCLRSSYADDRAALYSVRFLGEYEDILSEISPGDCVLDAGANIGVFTVLASSLVGSTGRVVAVEPQPENLRVLRRNIELNGCRNVSVVPRALSNVDGSAVFITGRGIGAHLSRSGGIPVDTISLPSILTVAKLPRIDYLKMDIEGAEVRVFEAEGTDMAISTLRRAVVEIHDAEADRRLTMFFRSKGFEVGDKRNDLQGRKRLIRRVLASPFLTLKLYRRDLLKASSRFLLPKFAASRAWFVREDGFQVGIRTFSNPLLREVSKQSRLGAGGSTPVGR